MEAWMNDVPKAVAETLTRYLAYRLKVFRQIGLAKPQLPHRLAIAGYQLAKWGPGFSAAVAAAAARFPRQTAIIDDIGEITWTDLRDQINQLTHALNERGVETGDSVAVLARNHRYLVMSMIAIMQAGARVLLLNTDRDETFEIAPGDRIAQLLITPVAEAEPLEVAGLAASARGDDGFGSSGR